MGPGSAPSERTARIHLKLGDALSRAGNPDEARRTFELAAAIARRIGSSETFAMAALGYGSAEKIRAAYGGVAMLAKTDVMARCIELLEAALATLPAEDSALRARVLALLAIDLYWQEAAPGSVEKPAERRHRFLSLSSEALDMALRISDREALVEALYCRQCVTLAPDSLPERLESTQRLLLAATGASNDEFAFLAHHARVHCFLELCDVGSVDAEIEAMDLLAQRTRQPLYRWHVATLRGMRTLLEGYPGEAERQMRDALDRSGLGEDGYVRYMFEFAQLYAIRWTQGRLGEMADRIQEHGIRFRGFARWRDAQTAAEIRDERLGRAELERYAREDFSGMPRAGLWILHMASLAEVTVLLRDERRAAILYELLAPYEERNAIPVATVPFGPVATRLAMLATLLKRWTEAEAHYERAHRLCEAMGARAIHARVLVEEARMLHARGRRSDVGRATDILSEARAVSEELDLPGIGARADELSRAGSD
jgi:hypothetical protein